jgi:hypothetical protein
MRIWLQNFVSIQPRTSLEKSDVSWPNHRICGVDRPCSYAAKLFAFRRPEVVLYGALLLLKRPFSPQAINVHFLEIAQQVHAKCKCIIAELLHESH